MKTFMDTWSLSGTDFDGFVFTMGKITQGKSQENIKALQ